MAKTPHHVHKQVNDAIERRTYLAKKGSQMVQEYVHIVKSVASEIFLIDRPILEKNFTLHTLNGLDSDFYEITAPIRVREQPLSFEELHDLLINHDAYLCCLEATSQQLVVMANYSHRKFVTNSTSRGH